MRTPRPRAPRRLPARGLVPLAVAALVFGVRYDADAAAALQKNGDGVLVQRAQGLPDLARGRQAAADSRLDDAESDLKPLAERGYVEAQIALGRLYARIGTPERITEAISWLRIAHNSSPEPTEVPLGRLLARQSDEASLSEGEALLSSAWDRRKDPEALAGLIRLYSEHPERDTQQRIGALIVRGETIKLPDVQGAVIGWYRSTPQIDGHREKVVSLCMRWVDGVPECYVDLARAARQANNGAGDVEQLKLLSKVAAHRYEQGIVQAQTLASLARVLVEAPDDGADDVAPAALPVKVSDLPEDDDAQASSAVLRQNAASSGAKTCATAPIITAKLDPAAAANAGAAPAVEAPASSAQPDLANALLEKLMKGREDAPVLAAGVVSRFPYLLPGTDIEASLKDGLGRGVPEARLYLGQLYLVGARAPRDPTLALQYLRQAADDPATALQGHYYLGRLYQYGYLDESQPMLAAEHLMWAARRGYVGADSSLARLFANGKGLCPNLVNAYVFAKLGAREGSASTLALQKQIAAQMSAAQLGEAEGRVVAELQARPSAYEIPKTLLASEQAADGEIAASATADAGDATPSAAVPAAAAATDTATAPEVMPAPAKPTLAHGLTPSLQSETGLLPAQPSVPLAAAAPTAAPSPQLIYSKTLSYMVPAEVPDNEAASATSDAAAPRGEIRLSHTPSSDPALRAVLPSEPAPNAAASSKEIDFQIPAEAPSPAPAAQAMP